MTIDFYVFKYNIRYNINYWGSKKSCGYVFAESKEDVQDKLEQRFGKINYSDLNNSVIIGFDIEMTDFIDL